MAWAPFVASLVGKGAGALSNIIGGDAADQAQQDAIGNAKTDINGAAATASGFQNPIYQTGLTNLNNLSNNYNSGSFSNPTVTPYSFDPSTVANDPEFKASLAAGTAAINGGAEKNGTLFSGGNDRDLQQFGQNTFAGMENQLEQQGFQASNAAEQENAANKAQAFQEGNQLASTAQPAANQLTNINTNLGENLGNLDLGAGAATAKNDLNTSSAISNLLGGSGGAGDQTSQYLQNLLNPTKKLGTG